MASLSDPGLYVVWKIPDIILGHLATKKSESFLLFDKEVRLELDLRYYRNKTELDAKFCIRPFNFDFQKVQIKTLISSRTYGSDLLYTCNKRINGEAIGSFFISVDDLPCKDCEVSCLFQRVFPFVQYRPKNETICLTLGTTCPGSLSSDLGQLLEDKTFSDVILKCRDGSMSAHRSVLAARSSVFAAMFRNQMAESENGVVEMDDVDLGILESFLKYVYSGRVTDLSENMVSTLFSMSDKYAIQQLQQECSKWMCKSLTSENYIKFLQLADAHNCEALKNGVIDFMVSNSSLLKSDEWSQFKELNPKLAFFAYERCFDIMSKK